jgi:hypothetical protein
MFKKQDSEKKGLGLLSDVMLSELLEAAIAEGNFIPNSVQAGIIFAELSKRTKE